MEVDYDGEAAAGRYSRPYTVADSLPYSSEDEDRLLVAQDTLRLPLFFTINRNRLTYFRTYAVFSYDGTDTAALPKALQKLAARFGRLRQPAFRRRLLRQERLVLGSGLCEEIYYLSAGSVETGDDSLRLWEAMLDYRLQLRR